MSTSYNELFLLQRTFQPGSSQALLQKWQIKLQKENFGKYVLVVGLVSSYDEMQKQMKVSKEVQHYSRRSKARSAKKSNEKNKRKISVKKCISSFIQGSSMTFVNFFYSNNYCANFSTIYSTKHFSLLDRHIKISMDIDA